MAGGLFSRAKTWVAEVLTYSDLNTEFDNIITNFIPSMMDDSSATEALMQATTDPYPASVASLATSLEGELKRIRYILQQITGEAYWYVDPSGKNWLPRAAAGGTADAITADFTPNITLSDMMTVAVVAGAANTTTTPTFAPDGLTAHTIVKRGGNALAANDIAGAGHVILLCYNLANTRWELLNPAT